MGITARNLYDELAQHLVEMGDFKEIAWYESEYRRRMVACHLDSDGTYEVQPNAVKRILRAIAELTHTDGINCLEQVLLHDIFPRDPDDVSLFENESDLPEDSVEAVREMIRELKLQDLDLEP